VAKKSEKGNSEWFAIQSGWIEEWKAYLKENTKENTKIKLPGEI